MKKNIARTLLLTTAITATFAVTSSLAASNAFPHYNDPAVFTLIDISPTGKKVQVEKFKLSIGATCQTLHPIVQSQFEAGHRPIIRNVKVPKSSYDIKLLYGEALGCIQFTSTINGKDITTGPIKLTWNPITKEYTKASPRIAIMDYSNFPETRTRWN